MQKSVNNIRHFLVQALVAGIIITYAGLVNAEGPDSKLAKPDQAAQARLIESYGKLPLSFIQNDGQIDERVKYYEKSRGHSTYFTKEGIYLELIRSEQAESTVDSPPVNAVRTGRQSAVGSEQTDGHSEIDESFHVVNSRKQSGVRSNSTISTRNSQLDNPKSLIVNRNSEIPNQLYTYTFEVASYDKRYSLKIDPVLSCSTYLGGDNQEMGYGIAIAVDASGSAICEFLNPSLPASLLGGNSSIL